MACDLKNLDLKLYGEVPEDIIEAATKIEMWTKKNGWVRWCLGGVADRALVEDLQYRIRMIEKAIQGSV